MDLLIILLTHTLYRIFLKYALGILLMTFLILWIRRCL